MEIVPVSEAQQTQLRERLPEEAVTAHPTKTFLSSIKSIYITERLNKVFGIGGWQIKADYITTGEKSMVVIKVTFTVPKHGIYYECFGGNDNGGEDKKGFDLGDAYKGAISDAIGKIASWMEIGADVFKGKQTGDVQKPTSQSTTSQSTDDKKWLNTKTEEWDSAVKYLSENPSKIEKIKEKYKISKSNEAALLAEAAVLIKQKAA